MAFYSTAVAVALAFVGAYLFAESRFAWFALGAAVALFTEQAIKRWKLEAR